MSEPTLKERIQEDMKNAMRAKDKERLGAIRLILAAVKQIEVDERIEIDDARLSTILNKMIKQRQDSIEQYTTANRTDLVEIEEFEVKLIQEYIPAQMSEDEIETLVKAAVAETGASSMKDMGKVMGILKEKTAGRADGAILSAKVKEHLSA